MKTYLSIILAVLLTVPFCVAAGPVADPENYKPSPFANDRLSLIGSDMMDSLSFGLSLFIDYDRKPIVMNIIDVELENPLRTVIENHLTADLMFSLGLFEWVDLGLAIPVVMFQDGYGWKHSNYPPTGTLGDLRFAARVRLYRTAERFFSLAFIPAFTFPTGKFLHDLSGSDGLTFSPTIAMTFWSRWVSGGIDLYYRMTQYDTVIATTRIADQVGIKALVTAYAIPEVLGINAELMAASTTGKTFGEAAGSPMETTLSLTWWHAPENISLTAGAGAGIVNGFGTPQFRVFAGFSWTLKQEEKEPEPAATEPAPAQEAAPAPKETPAPASMTSEPEPVAPPRPKAVELDLSPKPAPQAKTTEPSTPPQQSTPAPAPVATPTPKVTAPAPAPVVAPTPKTTAPAPAPVVAPAPKTAAPAPAPVVAPAPKTAAPAPAPVVAPAPKQPAPAPVPAPVKKAEPRTGTPMAEIIYFKENSTQFTDDSRVKLEKLNLLLSANFTLRIRIEGHTDRNEKPELALKRAQAIKLWFVDHDIESARIQTRGIGADEPVASSDLESDRTRNRRVTFFVLDN